LPAWEPGAHIDVLLPTAAATATPAAPGDTATATSAAPAAPIIRQYSLCGDPSDRTAWRVAVLREQDGRGGSAFVHDRLAEGDEVTVRGPRNHFALLPAKRYLFVAGGIGITPILPMLEAATRAAIPWDLLYGGRTAASMAFADRLRAYGSRVQIRPQDQHGLLDLATFLDRPLPDTLVYACGPEPLLQAMEMATAEWPKGALHTERFIPREISEEDRAAEQEFEVVLARSGKTLRVQPGRSILETIEDAGIDVLCSCREGTCGTCETDVLEGTPDHRDSLLTPDEREAGDTMFICVSRARTPRLVLDI
ncbi:MAG TPA: PDR/VanB family oxidoreductase, partial [Actinocrinis sp.]|nr:PDR/VanB family oxidoreductase [Actinocrinis sp.]